MVEFGRRNGGDNAAADLKKDAPKLTLTFFARVRSTTTTAAIPTPRSPPSMRVHRADYLARPARKRSSSLSLFARRNKQKGKKSKQPGGSLPTHLACIIPKRSGDEGAHPQAALGLFAGTDWRFQSAFPRSATVLQRRAGRENNAIDALQEKQLHEKLQVNGEVFACAFHLSLRKAIA